MISRYSKTSLPFHTVESLFLCLLHSWINSSLKRNISNTVIFRSLRCSVREINPSFLHFYYRVIYIELQLFIKTSFDIVCFITTCKLVCICYPYFFLGCLELKEDTIENLLAAACLLQLPQVVEVCCHFLMKLLHPSNCLGIRAFADAQGCTELMKVAHNYTMVRQFWNI